MQTMAVKTIVLTFLDDAAELAAGVYGVLAEIVTAPFERIARASDIAGVLPERRTRRRIFSFGWPFSFRNLKHLT